MHKRVKMDYSSYAIKDILSCECPLKEYILTAFIGHSCLITESVYELFMTWYIN